MADDAPKPQPDKSDLVNEAWRLLKIPSYVAWAMTVPELRKALKEAEH